MHQRERDLAEAPITKLLAKLSIPAMTGMLVMALYNLVDAIFVGQKVGVNAIAAISITFPINIIVMAFAQMAGIGGASVISRNLGMKNKEKAAHTVGNIYVLIFFMSSIIAIIGSIFNHEFMLLLGSSQNILGYAVDYMRITFPGAITFSLLICSNNILRSEGNAKTAMFTMIATAILNIVLDSLFILVFEWGVTGAALATFLSQLTVVFYFVYYFLADKSIFNLRLHHFKPDLPLIKEISSVGTPSFARQVAGSVVAFLLNRYIMHHSGDVTLAAFGVIHRIIMFVFMPVFGVIQGFLPITGYNYGAQNFARVKETFYKATIACTLILATGFIVLMLFPGQIVRMFNDSEELINTATHLVRIMILVLPIIGFQITGASIFQAFGKTRPAIVLALARQVIFFIPLLIILPMFFKSDGIWMTFPAADILASFITFVYVKKELKLLSN